MPPRGTPSPPRPAANPSAPGNRGAGTARELGMTRGQYGRATAAALGAVVAGTVFAGLKGNNKIPDPFRGEGISFPDDLNTLNHYVTFRAVEQKEWEQIYFKLVDLAQKSTAVQLDSHYQPVLALTIIQNIL